MVTHQRKLYVGMEKSLVIGIDVGTTFSGVSYVLLESGKAPRIQPVTRFSGQREEKGKSKVRSVVCYDQDGNVIAAGSETDPEANAMLSVIEDVRQAEQFKLSLCLATYERSQPEKMRPRPELAEGPDGNIALGIEPVGGGKVERSKGTRGERDGGKEVLRNTPSREVIEHKLLNKRNIPRPVTDDFKTPDRIFIDFLRYLFKSAKKYITESERKLDPTFTWSSIERNTYLVLTHPDGWGRKQQSQMRDAAIAADLVNRSTVVDRLTFVSESEASLHFCLDKKPELHQERGGILVVDCGGGTIGLSAYSQTRQGDFKEITSPNCLLQGSISITSRARDYFKGRFKGSKYGADHVIEAMARAFDKPEGIKCMFRCSDRPYFVKFGGLRDNDQEYGICGGKFKVEGAQLAKFFEPAVENIIAEIENQCRDVKDGISIKCVLLVGGFGRSQYLYAKLRDHFNSSGIVVLRPDMTHPNKAVADGAVSWFLDHYVSTHSYGVMASHLLDPADPDHLDRVNMRVTQANGESYIPGILSTILKMDSEVLEETQFRQAQEFVPIQQCAAWTTANTPINEGQVADVNQAQLPQAPVSQVARLNQLVVGAVESDWILEAQVSRSDIKRLQAKLETLDQLLQEMIVALSKREQLIHDLSATNQRQRGEIKQMKTARPASADSEQISVLAPPTIVNKADSISVAGVAELLRSFTGQVYSGIEDSPSYQEPLIPSKELEDLLNEFTDYAGPPNDFSIEPRLSITQIALQSGLVNACSHIVNNGIPPSDGATLSRVHNDMTTPDQAVADAGKAHPHTYTTISQNEAWESNRKYPTEIVLKLVTAVWSSLESGGAVPPRYRKVLEETVKPLALHKAVSEGAASLMDCLVKARTYATTSQSESLEINWNLYLQVAKTVLIFVTKLLERGVSPPLLQEIIKASLKRHKVISEYMIPVMKLVTYPTPCHLEFDPVEMEEKGGGDGNETTQNTVICTPEIGLECRKRKESGSGGVPCPKLQKVLGEGVVSMMELVTIPCDADFDFSRMEDADGEEAKTGSSVCNMKMTESDLLMAQIAPHLGLVNGCIHNGITSSDSAGQTDADAWKLHTYTTTSQNESSPIETRAMEHRLTESQSLTKGTFSATIGEVSVVDGKARKSTLKELGCVIFSRPTYVSPISPLMIPFY